jgi:L-aspartate oxidase
MTSPLPELHRRYLASFRVSQIPHRFTDVLVLGSGVAGLSAVIAAAAEPDVEVLLVAKSTLEESATRWAQGGVAAVLAPERTGDSLEQHIEDTLEVAAGLADPEVVRLTVTEGAERVRQLIALGAEFDRDAAGEIHFTREGGHSHPRILHRGDSTGEEIERALLAAALGRENVLALAQTFAIDLITEGPEVRGALLYRPGSGFEAVWARQTVLATGGAGRLYRETTNPTVCTGDGIAMAFRAGAVLQDLEFVQFHPTTLYLAGAERFLITEAVRGEGGVLRDGAGNAFMERFHPRKDLAPRDVVSRGILHVMKERGENKVWLDLSAIPQERIRSRFPRILEICQGFGIDIIHDPIPVRPSAHYSIGGVRTDLDGRTSLDGLLAAGEVASTGLHGANRMGSNSLLEGLVLGHRAGRLAASCARGRPAARPFSLDAHGLAGAASGPAPPAASAAPFEARRPAPVPILPGDLLSSLQSLLWYKVGLERSGPELEEALAQIGSWVPYALGRDFQEPAGWSLQNMLQTAYLITLSALRREESRGVHYRSDFPERDDRGWRKHQAVSRDEV